MQECQTQHWASHKEVCRLKERPTKKKSKKAATEKVEVKVTVTGRQCSSCGRQEAAGEAAGSFKCCGRCRTALYCTTVGARLGVVCVCVCVCLCVGVGVGVLLSWFEA